MITPLTGHVTTAAAKRFVCTAHAVELSNDARVALTDTDRDTLPVRDGMNPTVADADGDGMRVLLLDLVVDRDGDADGET